MLIFTSSNFKVRLHPPGDPAGVVPDAGARGGVVAGQGPLLRGEHRHRREDLLLRLKQPRRQRARC